MVERTYIAIDLKSFYASSECVELGFDPLRTHLVVADESRTDKTICLAVSPSLKAYGLPGRARLFEVREKLRQINAERQLRAPGHRFRGTSYYADELEADPSLAVDVYIAKPRMSHYLNASGKIYGIYLRYASADDIHVYSIDEVFMDATRYLHAYGKTPHELARDIVRAIYNETGITATAGIGTNLYLAKVAMDIVAKHIPADAEGVRIAQLDEMSYRRLLWGHRPLTDFWRVGRGYAKKLESHGLMTMGDIARWLTRASLRLLQRGTALPPVRRQRGAAHRPCVGMGALHHSRHQSVQARRTQCGVRAGADQCDAVRHRPADREGNGGNTGIGLGEQGAENQQGGARCRLRYGKS